jgi:hypothetical protein
MQTLGEIRERVEQLIGGSQYLGFVNARLVLRTGISLSHQGNPSPEELSNVVAALRDMGYPVDGQGAQP